MFKTVIVSTKENINVQKCIFDGKNITDGFKNFRDGGTLLPKLLRPKSRGHLRLRSGNPFEHPIIEPNYYSHPHDVATMREGLKWGLRMTETEVFKENKLIPVADKYTCGQHKEFSDAYFECFLVRFYGPPFWPESFRTIFYR
jgi:choline dehydrogenase-like flavoprotein